jgi:1-acyl-sn-glycerol-3-phosphate acyltransferase
VVEVNLGSEAHSLKSAPRGYGNLLRWLCSLILKWAGWKYSVQFPDSQKFILIGAPHTTNWDWMLMFLVTRSANIYGHWLAKDSLFRPPLGGLMRRLGGISIDRSQRSNFVLQVINAFKAASELIIIIAPEGTRGKTNFWKSGFYYIALGANVPIALAGIDYPTKTLTVDTWFYPSGDVKGDMDIVRTFYANKRGKYPAKQGEPRLAAEEDSI